MGKSKCMLGLLEPGYVLIFSIVSVRRRLATRPLTAAVTSAELYRRQSIQSYLRNQAGPLHNCNPAMHLSATITICRMNDYKYTNSHSPKNGLLGS
jgi:hypothetical protein